MGLRSFAFPAEDVKEGCRVDPRDPRFEKTFKHAQQQWLIADRVLSERQKALSGYKVPIPDAATLGLLKQPVLGGFVSQTERLVQDIQQRIASILKSAFRPLVIPNGPLVPQLNVRNLISSIPKIVNFESLSESFRELMEAARQGDLPKELHGDQY